MNNQLNIVREIEKDYNEALVHLMWIVKPFKDEHNPEIKSIRKLIFGLVELYPKEEEICGELPEQRFKVKGKNFRLYYTRCKMSSKQALRWYIRAHKKTKVQLPHQKNDYLACGDLVAFPKCPHFSISNDLPFVPHYRESVRCHHLMPIELDYDINELFSYQKVIDLTKEWLNWDISNYSEYLGSFNLILPNPIFRKLSCRLMPDTNDQQDRICMDIIPREGMHQDLKKLELYHIEGIHDELAGGHHRKYLDCQTIIECCGIADKSSYIIKCPKRGLLHFSPMNSFLRQIKFTMNVCKQERQINILDKNKILKDSYSIDVFETVANHNHDDDSGNLPQIELYKKIIHPKMRRKKQDEAAKYGQNTFYKEHEKARDFIRKLINSAHENIIIIDPYFSGIELVKYIFAVSRDDIDIKILTSAEHLKEKIANNREKWEELSVNLKKIDNKIEVSVMTGSAAFHDRYLIIDNDVWFSGNSLHTLGERVSTIIKLPDSSSIIKHLNTISLTHKVKLFEEWSIERAKI